ncbi:hypothetical protein Tco_1029661 [Tanacetum coccineum]|uniref:Uncharacterized protein n=1 Tax=Tanacetum coccineum TaxID=301880 RepID=A0ABQ5G4D0_9ASTR
MDILLEPTPNKLMVGDLCDSIRIKHVTTGKKRWCDSIRIKLVPEHAEFDESNANVLERFYILAGNPVKEILHKMNLPDHKSILIDSKEQIKMEMEEELTAQIPRNDQKEMDEKEELLGKNKSEFSQQRIGTSGLLDSFSCGKEGIRGAMQAFEQKTQDLDMEFIQVKSSRILRPLYGVTIIIKEDDLSESALRRNTGDKVTPFDTYKKRAWTAHSASLTSPLHNTVPRGEQGL